MSYHFAETEGASPDAPLVLTFHGTGGDERQFHDYASALWRGAHVISPRGDVSEAGALRYFRRTGEGVYDMDDLAARTAAMGDFIAAQKARTGAAQVIAMGYSNGANILAAVMFDRPDLVDRAALMHPLIPWEPAPQPGLAGRAVLITAGERDPICPAPMTRALAAYLSDQGAVVSSHWHPGGHEIARTEVDALRAFAAA